MAEVFLSIGSNIDREKYIRACLRALREGFGELTLSRIYESEAVGFEGNNFYNLVVSFTSSLSPMQLINKFKQLEF